MHTQTHKTIKLNIILYVLSHYLLFPLNYKHSEHPVFKNQAKPDFANSILPSML